MIAEYVGVTLPSSRPYVVGREKVREFARGPPPPGGAPASVCADLDAARKAGHPDLVAPPTFAATITLPLMEAFLRDPAVGWDYGHMVHGEQSFTAHRPLCAGDEVVTTLHVDELRTRAGSLFLTLRAEIADAAGAPVLTATSLMVTVAAPTGAATEPATGVDR